jgi:hypothetical protein
MKPMNYEFLVELVRNNREDPLVNPKYRTLDDFIERIKSRPESIEELDANERCDDGNVMTKNALHRTAID